MAGYLSYLLRIRFLPPLSTRLRCRTQVQSGCAPICFSPSATGMESAPALPRHVRKAVLGSFPKLARCPVFMDSRPTTIVPLRSLFPCKWLFMRVIVMLFPSPHAAPGGRMFCHVWQNDDWHNLLGTTLEFFRRNVRAIAISPPLQALAFLV
jgi:hypothetical protein